MSPFAGQFDNLNLGIRHKGVWISQNNNKMLPKAIAAARAAEALPLLEGDPAEL